MNSELTNNKQANDNKVDSPLSWIIASLGQVAHFTSVVIRNDNKVDSPLTTHNSLVKAIAFTLAETLVVMGIIGVVAALTIPNLNQSTGDREKVAKVKKIYSNLEDAFGRATAVYGPYDEWKNGVTDNSTKVFTTKYVERLTEFMKVSKNCKFDEGCNALNNAVLSFEGSTEKEDLGYTYYSVVLADGTSLSFSGGSDFLIIVADIDGLKGPNTYAKDIFTFMILTENNESVLYPSYYAKPEDCERSKFSETSDMLVMCATNWVIKNGNLDYLKCPDELNWNTKTSCK